MRVVWQAFAMQGVGPLLSHRGVCERAEIVGGPGARIVHRVQHGEERQLG